jgi:DNA-directed RNA polymerase beta' subunit
MLFSQNDSNKKQQGPGSNNVNPTFGRSVRPDPAQQKNGITPERRVPSAPEGRADFRLNRNSTIAKRPELVGPGATLEARGNHYLRNKKVKNNIYTSYSKLSEVKLLTIGIASPLRILQWAEKTLPNGKIYGEVLNANTLHHKTFKPQKGGLFCERIFGPLKDFECACGKINKTVKQDMTSAVLRPPVPGETRSSSTIDAGGNVSGANGQKLNSGEIGSGIASAPLGSSLVTKAHKSKQTRKYCPDCDVEYTWSVIRRYQLGYIKLSSPVTHIWFLKGTPSYLSLLLDMKKRHLQLVTYCSETLTLEHSLANSQKSLFIDSPSKIFETWEALWRPQKETLTREKTGYHKRLDVQPIPQKDWQKRMSISPSQPLSPPTSPKAPSAAEGKKGASGALSYTRQGRSFIGSDGLSQNDKSIEGSQPFDITHMTLNKELNTVASIVPFGDETLSPKFLKRSGAGSPTKTNKLPLFLSTLQWSIYCNRQTESNREPHPLHLSGTSLPTSPPSGATPALCVASRLVGPSGPRLGAKLYKITKKLPIDYYILCSLDRLLQKKVIRFAILNTWQTLYKDAYIKAMYKTNKLFVTDALPPSAGEIGPHAKVSFGGKAANPPPPRTLMNKKKQFLNIGKFYSLFYDLSSTQTPSASKGHNRARGPESVALKAQKRNATMIQTDPRHRRSVGRKFQSVVNKVKVLFLNHVGMIFRKMKQPIYLNKYTTSLQFSNLDILMNATMDMQKYLPLPTSSGLGPPAEGQKGLQGADFIKILSNAFLRPVLTIQLFSRSHNSLKMPTGSLSQNVPSAVGDEPKRPNPNPFGFKQVAKSDASEVVVGHELSSNLFGSNSLKESISFLNNTAYLRATLTEGSTDQGLQGAEYPSRRDGVQNYLLLYKQKMKEFYSIQSRLGSAKGAMTAPVGDDPNDFVLKELSMNNYFRSKTVTQAIPLEPYLDKLGDQEGWPANSTGPNIYRSLRKNRKNMSIGNNGSFSSKNRITFSDSHKSVYNNIYSLSHRERWEAEKDCQIFLIYSVATAEFNDIPIFAYKSRVFSFSEKNSFRFATGAKRPPQTLVNADGSQPFSASYGPPGSLNGPNRPSGLPRSQTHGPYVSANETLKGSVALSNAFFSGAGIIQQLLRELTFPELKKLDKQNRLLLYQLNQNIFKIKKQVKIFVYDKSARMELKDLCKKRDLLIRRTKLVRKLFRKDSDPSSMILTVLPVLPPDLRPIVKMGSQIAASDLNRLYQQVIHRNERLKFFLKDPATSHSYEMKYAQRLLQEAVDNLIQNSKTAATSEKDSRGRALKSLSDVLKGKQGRFRQFLLGKRVDYSGRSVIVVGPKLKLHECGLPVEMALELYLPFLLKRILNKKYAKTVIGAKSLIKNNTALAHELLREIMQVSPVLLNRAPTLHRLGIQAFVPKLVEGRAILLHPLVCSAFNADFDGDQMAVHVPITVEARAEAWKLMLSRNNILSPATGDPLAIPSQDMVLGCYYLTTYSKSLNRTTPALRGAYSASSSSSSSTIDIRTPQVSTLPIQAQQFYFNHLEDVIQAYNQQKVKIHTLVWVKWNGLIENGTDQEEPIEVRLTAFGQWQEISAHYLRFYDSKNVLVNQYMATTPGRILFNLIIQDSLN